jgi:tripartite-type tricarboxylate transporter receptor subunit TctC
MQANLRRRTFLAAGAPLVLPFLSTAAHAQDFPSRPVTLIAPSAPGGTTDVTFRALAKATEPHLGQTILIDNKPGANTSLGVQAVSKGKPDGYQLAIMLGAVLRNQLMNKVAYDALTELTPIIQVTAFDVGMIVKADSPLKSFKDFIADAKKRPGQLNYGTNGPATSQHLLMMQVAAQEGIQIQYVPFKSEAEGTQAVLGGHIDAYGASPAVGSLVDSGRARWLAVFSDKRLKKWPDAPTLIDLGYKLSASSFAGIVGPAGMPQPVVARLHDAFRKGMADPGFIQMLDRFAMDVHYADAAGYASSVREQYAIEKDRLQRAGLLP